MFLDCINQENKERKKNDTTITFTYLAIFTPIASGKYVVRFPKLNGCTAIGDDLREAEKQAEKTVREYILDKIAKKEPFANSDIPSLGEIPEAGKGEIVEYISFRL